MVDDGHDLSYVLTSYRWLCSCGDAFDEPEELTGHRTSLRNRREPMDGHKLLGYGDPVTREIILKTGHKVWKGYWRELLAKRFGGNGAGPDDEGEDAGEDGAFFDAEAAFREAVGDDDQDGDDPEYGPHPSNEDDEIEETEEGRGTRQHHVKVQYRPQVFEMDEAVVHLFHLHMAAAERLGVRYQPKLGEWIRQVVFQFSIEHPELVDLSAILSPQERQAIAASAAGGNR